MNFFFSIFLSFPCLDLAMYRPSLFVSTHLLGQSCTYNSMPYAWKYSFLSIVTDKENSFNCQWSFEHLLKFVTKFMHKQVMWVASLNTLLSHVLLMTLKNSGHTYMTLVHLILFLVKEGNSILFKEKIDYKKLQLVFNALVIHFNVNDILSKISYIWWRLHRSSLLLCNVYFREDGLKYHKKDSSF